MLGRAKEKADDHNLRAEFGIDDAENLSLEDVAFDDVINRHLLQTLPDLEQAISEWRRVLKPGGEVVIIDENRGDRGYFLLKGIKGNQEV